MKINIDTIDLDSIETLVSYNELCEVADKCNISVVNRDEFFDNTNLFIVNLLEFVQEKYNIYLDEQKKSMMSILMKIVYFKNNYA